MTTFKDYEYKKPDLAATKSKFHKLLEEFKAAKTVEEQSAVISAINELRNNFSTQSTLVEIRASIDTNNEFYQKERDYFDEINPEMDDLVTEYYKALTTSAFKQELQEKWGQQLFDLAEYQIKSFSPELISLMQKENKLTSEYSKLVASAQIDFNGEVLTLAQLGPYGESTNAETRKKAKEASFGFFKENEAKFDEIYDELVKVRHEMAVKLGYKNFVELGYIQMNRIDYNAEMVKKFRDQVRDYIVPVANKLYERQAKRIGVDKLKYQDEGLNFLTGNATPKGTPEWIVENGKKMYEELSPETAEFFNFMIDNELMDLVAKKGKEGAVIVHLSMITNHRSFSQTLMVLLVILMC